MKKYNIPEHWDVTGQITAHSDPESEFILFQNNYAKPNMGWKGDEFCLDDFISYIDSLKNQKGFLNFY